MSTEGPCRGHRVCAPGAGLGATKTKGPSEEGQGARREWRGWGFHLSVGGTGGTRPCWMPGGTGVRICQSRKGVSGQEQVSCGQSGSILLSSNTF